MTIEISQSTPTSGNAVVLPSGKTAGSNPQTLTRVLHVINGEHFAGAERVQQHLGNQLSQFGYDPVFACLKPGKFRDCAGLKENQVVDAPMESRYDLSAANDLCQLIEEEGIELLHAHTPRSALVTSLASHRSDTPWVYHVHSPAARDSTRGFVNRFNAVIERYSIRSCDLLITVSKSLRREMLRQGVPRVKLAVVANGVPALPVIDAKCRLEQANWTLGMIALMRPRKGVEIALEAMKRIKDRNLPVKLKLIGSFETAEYEAEIMQLQDSLGVADVVEWTGFTNDVPGEIQTLDGMLLPSLFGEGMPMVVLEAISAGVPVVATLVEGTPEVVRDGCEGFLAKPGDADSLTEAICQLITDRARWAELSKNAVARHRDRFSEVGMAERVARAYDRVLD